MTFKLLSVVTDSAWKPRTYSWGTFSILDMMGTDNILINYAGAGKLGEADLPSRNRYFIAGDSGGLQNARFGKEFDPAAVAEWYNGKVTIGMALDKIPSKIEGESLTTGVWLGDNPDFLRQCAEQTRKNVEVMAKVRRDFDLYYIYQGNDWATHDLWHKHSEPGLAQGVAFKQGRDFRKNAQFLAFIWETFKDTQPPIHFLGVGGASKYIPLIFFSRYWKGLITCDSSRHKYAAVQRVYPNPLGLGEYRFGEENATQLTELPCDCAACEMHSKHLDGFFRKDAGDEALVWSANLLMAHNAFIEGRRARLLSRLVSHRDYFKKVVRQNGASLLGNSEGELDTFGCLDLIEFIQLMCEEGLATATQKYPVLATDAEEFF